VRLSDLEPRFTCQACGWRGADLRPNFGWHLERHWRTVSGVRREESGPTCITNAEAALVIIGRILRAGPRDHRHRPRPSQYLI